MHLIKQVLDKCITFNGYPISKNTGPKKLNTLTDSVEESKHENVYESDTGKQMKSTQS